MYIYICMYMYMYMHMYMYMYMYIYKVEAQGALAVRFAPFLDLSGQLAIAGRGHWQFLELWRS